MAINSGDLKAISAAPTAVGSFKAVLAALVGDQTITADVAGIVGHALDHAGADVEKAINANVNISPAKA